MNGEPVDLKGPRDAFDHGIAMVYQEQSILRTLNVAENVFLGREAEFTRFGVLNKAAMNAAARAELAKVHLDIDPVTLCGDLTFAQRQMVEIANAVSLDSRIEGNIVILLDEPTSVLESKEIKVLFGIVRELKQRAAFVFISHRLDEVMDLSDRIYVMRDGKVVAEMPAGDATVSRLHELMVGRTLRPRVLPGVTPGSAPGRGRSRGPGHHLFRGLPRRVVLAPRGGDSRYRRRDRFGPGGACPLSRGADTGRFR